MLRTAFRTSILGFGLLSAAQASAEDYWRSPEPVLDAAISAAADLYAAEVAPDPFKPVVLDGPAPELAAIYAALDERSPPMKIYSFTNDPDEPQDYSALPSAFAPGSAEDQMIRFIRRYEAGDRGYDAVWHGSRHPLPKKPTQMTICEIRDWQLEAAKVQDSTAIGLFQMVGPTFRSVTKKMGLPCDLLFDQKTQDRIGLALLYGRGWADFKTGKLSVRDFGFELAGEWAAFPATYGKNRGISRHAGVGDNKHQVDLQTYTDFLTELQRQAMSGEIPAPELLAETEEEEDLPLLVDDRVQDAAENTGTDADDLGTSEPPLKVVALEAQSQTRILTFTKD